MKATEGFKRLKTLEHVSEALEQLIDNEEYPDGGMIEEDAVKELRIINKSVLDNISKYRKALSDIEIFIE